MSRIPTIFIRSILVAAVACAVSCDGTPGRLAPNCVEFRSLGAVARAPSVVNLFFQLSTCDGDPLAGVTAERFLIQENGREVSVFESQQQYTTTPRCFESASVLMFDMSGSILSSGALPALQEAATAFAARVAAQQPVAMYTFDGRVSAELLIDFTSDADALAGAIASLSDYQTVDNSTNLNGAVGQGVSVLDQALSSAAQGSLRSGTLVIFTDGSDQAARVSDEQAVAVARATEHDVYTLGLGSEIDRNHLRNIGRSGRYFADDIDELNAAFDRAARDIENAANSYYELAYCTPKRAGSHTLELSLRGFSGDLRFQFNAEGFSGGCTPTALLGDECTLDVDGGIEQ